MLSNYPPGVTGMEPQINGYDEMEGTCPDCGTLVLMYGEHGVYEGTCGECEFDMYYEDEYDLREDYTSLLED